VRATATDVIDPCGTTCDEGLSDTVTGDACTLGVTISEREITIKRNASLVIFKAVQNTLFDLGCLYKIGCRGVFAMRLGYA
jgi:hypothetical protein